jgi:hypothetical protein
MSHSPSVEAAQFERSVTDIEIASRLSISR